MKRESDMCKICGSKGTTPYYYLSIKNKVQMWCSDAEFCVKVTAHWEDKDLWINCTGGWMPRKEIWDGSKYTAAASCFPRLVMQLPLTCDPLCSSVWLHIKHLIFLFRA